MENQKSILIVEDEEDLSDALLVTLRDAGYQVATSKNTEVGLQYVMANKPDLILLDVLTRSMHGVVFLERVRALPPGSNDSKVIVLTNLEHPETEEKFKRIGVEDYLIKSQVSLEQVAARVKECLG